jgi:phosphate transport system permease protein
MVSLLATAMCGVPVLALVAIVISTVANSLPAITRLGLPALLGPELSTPFARQTVLWGLQAPLWGTFLLLVLTLVLATPVALGMAIVAREFRVPLLSAQLNAVLGTLAGIPPVVYALMTVFLVNTFIGPKFAGTDLSDYSVRAAIQHLPTYNQSAVPAGMPNSMLLAAILQAMLVVPFMAPLMQDALAGVPSDLRQGALALGATRWFALRSIIFPWALPGIVSAVTLGMLLAIGELVIPYFVMGAGTHVVLPTPLWNVLQGTPPLGPAGAGAIGGVSAERGEGQQATQALGLSVAYTTGVLLALAAFCIMGVEHLVQRRLRDRAAA